MGYLDNLATELQGAIYKLLGKKSLCNVCLTSKSLCEIAIPILYNTMELSMYQQISYSKGLAAERKSYRQRYRQFMYQGHREPNLPANRWLRYTKNLAFLGSKKSRNMTVQDLTLDLCSDIGRTLAKDQLWTVSFPLNHHLPEFPLSLLSSQHQLHALSLGVTSYALFQQEFIPQILSQSRLTSLAIEVKDLRYGRSDYDCQSLVTFFNGLSETLVSLRVGNSLTHSSADVYTAIMNMKRLQQLAWMSSKRPSDTTKLSALNKTPGRGWKWLSAGLSEYDDKDCFFEPAFDFETIKSIHLDCRGLDKLQKILSECRSLETVALKFMYHEDITNFNWSGITQHWDSLTRLYILNLNLEGQDERLYTNLIANVLGKCVNLLEIGIPIPCEFAMESDAEVPDFSFENKMEGVQLRAIRSGLKFQWPEVSNNLRFLHLSNLRIRKLGHKLKFSIDEYWPIILEELLKVFKAPIPASRSTVPLPCLQSIFAGDYGNDSDDWSFNLEKGAPPEGYLVRKNEFNTDDLQQPSSSNPGSGSRLFSRSNRNTDIEWTIEKIDIDDLKIMFPEFHGFRFFDQNKLWSEGNGKFWD